MSIDVSNMPFAASGIFLFLPTSLSPHGEEPRSGVSNHTCAAPQGEGIDETFDATSAIAFITALRTPGSYSVCPAASTMRTSASLQRSARLFEIEGGQSRS